ncbi:MAG: hypothetical protein COA78_16490 [Blastopirellula sp.]|nr:MAG: hypothetical protein COA78_16490 [Blastopirellula sp.]
MLLPSTLTYAQESNPNINLKVFLNKHCIRCHGAEEQKGDRRFDLIQTDLHGEETLKQWQEILDAINLGEMPPEDEPQASVDQVKHFVGELTQQLRAAIESRVVEGKPHFRRLNRYEYRNTIRDLCGVNTESFDPTAYFPADERLDGFENIGEELVLSDYLLQRYLEAASQSIEKASQANSTIKPIHKVFSPNDMESRKFHFRPQISLQVNVDGSYVDVGHGDRKSDRVLSRSFQGVAADGFYTIRINAEGINREHPYDPKLLGIDRDEPIKLEVLVADPRVGSRLAGNATDRSVAVIPLKDHQAELYEIRTWMDKGYVPVLRYINGPQPIKAILSRIAPKYHADVLPSNWRSGTDRRPAETKKLYMSDVYQGPRMRIHWMELEGPESIPVKESSRTALYGKQAFSTDSIDPESVLRRFLFRSFRRPPHESEVTRYLKFLKLRRELGDSEETAFHTTFKAILCSPNFLYIEVPPNDTAPEQNQFKLASRLSYFLWSSMPDDELFEAAKRGELSDPIMLIPQVTRMLTDPKAKAFTEHFTDSWLHLNELGSMPPDTVKFSNFYKRQLQPLMKKETHHFFEHILANNLSVDHFIDSEFTFLNRYLADHYGIPDIVGDEFQKVTLPKDSLRGGLLGQASILTTTSNGVETSPVTRGIWVLENIFGTPPAPPPPDVDPLEPDIRGATTIREQLAKHRKIETCAECHRKIDPIGFALESFDPIGTFRSTYLDSRGKPASKVDTSGKLSSGENFSDLSELKQLLLQRKDQFAKCLTEKMLMYALGRELSLGDRLQVDAITETLSSRGHGLRDLVELIVLSEAFRE